MATDSVTVSPTFNGDTVPLTAGMIVRLKPGANNNVVRAQADSAPHVQGVNGVVVSGSAAPTGVVTVACVGRETVQMESGLTPAVGDTVYVSATVAGKGTNIIPGIVLPIGPIADVSAYATSKTVEVDVTVASSEAGAGGTFPGYGGAPPAVAAASSAGAAGTASRSDHTHAGVASLNAETGDVVIESLAGTVVVTAPDGTHINLEVANPVPGFATPTDLGPNEGVAGVAATIIRSDAIPGQKIQAAWPIANVRWYAVDGTNGNDANAGFSDVSSAAAGAVAKKTISGLAAIFPTVGHGRKAVVIFNQGTYTDNLDLLAQGLSGYAANYPMFLGTGTNATASAVAFAGDANDRIFVGAATAPGANAAGYNPIGTPSVTAIQCARVGGGTPGFGAEPALPLGARVRFGTDAGTQAALRNVCVAIIGVSTTTTANDTLLLPAAATGAGGLATVPILTDTFYVEIPGVNTGTFQAAIGPNAIGPGAVSNQLCPTFVGLNVATQTRIDGGRSFWAFCRHAFFTTYPNANLTQLAFSYHDETGGIRTVGPVRSDGLSQTSGPNGLNAANGNGQLFCGGILSMGGAETALFSNGSYCTGMSVFGSPGSVDDPNNQPGLEIGARVVNTQSTARIVGAATASAKTAGLAIQTSSVTVGKLAIAPGAFPAIALVGKCGLAVSSFLTGNTGTDVGLDLTGAQDSTIAIYSNPTVTGTSGDVRLSDGTIISWATAAAGVIDTNGNRLYTPGSAPLGAKVASAATAVALGNVAPGTVTSSTPTAWTPLVINGVKYLIPLWPST